MRLLIAIMAVVTFSVVWIAVLWAQSGPHILDYAPVSVPTSCATVAAESTPVPNVNSAGAPRLCIELNNVGGTPAVCGNAPVGGTSRGSYIPAVSSKTYCITDALTCCGVGGATTISPVETRR